MPIEVLSPPDFSIMAGIPAIWRKYQQLRDTTLVEQYTNGIAKVSQMTR
jgi:hypothetical protein